MSKRTCFKYIFYIWDTLLCSHDDAWGVSTMKNPLWMSPTWGLCLKDASIWISITKAKAQGPRSGTTSATSEREGRMFACFDEH